MPNEEAKTIQDLKKDPIDLTEKRRIRCKPIVDLLVREIINHELVFSDTVYVQQQVAGEVQKALEVIANNVTQLIVTEYAAEIISKITISLNTLFNMASEAKWGTDGFNITFKQLEEELKKNKK